MTDEKEAGGGAEGNRGGTDRAGRGGVAGSHEPDEGDTGVRETGDIPGAS